MTAGDWLWGLMFLISSGMAGMYLRRYTEDLQAARKRKREKK